MTFGSLVRAHILALCFASFAQLRDPGFEALELYNAE